jgi:hypothetical protein
MDSISRRSPAAALAAVAVAIAGAVHILIAPQHYQHAPAHGVFFLVAGLVEIGWAVAYFRKASRRLLHVGIGLGSSLIVLWLLTRSLPVPFGHDAEPVDTWAVVCKLSELVGVIALGVLAFQTLGEGTTRLANTRALLLAIVLGLAVGSATYVVARAAEPLLPALTAADENHHHSDEAIGHEEHEHEEGTADPTLAP